jgi:hypothetical protein
MPRETVTLRDGDLVVGWDEHGLVQIGVDLDRPFIFNDDQHLTEYTSLWVDLSVEDIDTLQKLLRRVKRYKSK